MRNVQATQTRQCGHDIGEGARNAQPSIGSIDNQRQRTCIQNPRHLQTRCRPMTSSTMLSHRNAQFDCCGNFRAEESVTKHAISSTIETCFDVTLMRSDVPCWVEMTFVSGKQYAAVGMTVPDTTGSPLLQQSVNATRGLPCWEYMRG